MPTCSRSFGFDMGHRVLGHEGKCRNLHGHRYTAEITVEAQSLDSLGRVIDFGVLKEVVQGWIDEHWDHNMCLHIDDPIFKYNEPDGVGICGRKPYVIPNGTNPTVENLVIELVFELGPKLKAKGLTLVHVKLWETPSCWAEWVIE